MTRKPAGFALLLVGSVLCAGCGGGDSSCCSSSNKAAARERVVATTRITRATFAIGGFGRRVTRSASIGPINRLGVWLAAIRAGRAVTSTQAAPAQDSDTGLYYTLTVNSDGSGRQDLFSDSALKVPAGAFTWTAPQWTNNLPGSYPATFQTVYQITAGEFAGEHGTIQVTADDATGANGEMVIDLTDAQGDRCVSDFTIVNGIISAKDRCTLADDTTYTETDTTTPSDQTVCTIDFPDGSQETSTVNPDGSGTQTLDNASGQTDATGSVQSNGNDTVQYDDGSSETVNVDTNSDTSSTDSRAARGRAPGRGMIPARKH